MLTSSFCLIVTSEFSQASNEEIKITSSCNCQDKMPHIVLDKIVVHLKNFFDKICIPRIVVLITIFLSCTERLQAWTDSSRLPGLPGHGGDSVGQFRDGAAWRAKWGLILF
jgi:hypothetical protein